MSRNSASLTARDRKPKAAAVTIEALLGEGRWDEARERLNRLLERRPPASRIGEILYHAADNPKVPDDVFETLFSKLKDGRHHQYAGGSDDHRDIERVFWRCVCKYEGYVGFEKEFKGVCHFRSSASLRLFVEAYAKVVGVMSIESARMLVSHLWCCYLFSDSRGRIAFRAKPDGAKAEGLLEIASMEDLQSKPVLHELWLKTELLIRATVKGGLHFSGVEQFPLIHKMIEVHVPRIVVWLATRLHPTYLCIKDAKGRLPLHLAARWNNADSENFFQIIFEGPLCEIVKKRYVELILEAFPAGAKCWDSKGSLPLAVLLDLEYRSWSDNEWTQRCVEALMEHAPEALIQRNAMNFMPPFLTGACLHDDNSFRAGSKYEERRVNVRKLNLAYTLLRQNPSVVSSGRTEPRSRELYLEKELESAESKMQRLRKENEKLQKENSVLKTKMAESTENEMQRLREENEKLQQENSALKTKLAAENDKSGSSFKANQVPAKRSRRCR